MQVAPEALARRIATLARGERLTVLGTGRDGIGDLLSTGSERGRGTLLVAGDGGSGVAALLDGLLTDLADLALACWPDDPGDREPIPSPDPWWKAAETRVRAGSPPRFRRMAPELEFVRLARAVDPAGIILVWEVDPASPGRAGPVIEALEWCARHGGAVVAALATEPPAHAPYDRILYGACELVRPPTGAGARFLAPTAGPHHASAVERRVAEALARDAELGALFVPNAPVPVGPWGAQARVDLLCPRYRVVVELDGPEHRAEPKFGNDRHRDYALLIAGYCVLRLTNAQVAADLALAIEKIRAVIHLRRRTHGG